MTNVLSIDKILNKELVESPLFQKKIRLIEDNNIKDYSKIDAIFLKLSPALNGKYLQKFKKLKYILCPTTGLNHIDAEYCDKIGVKILSLKGDLDYLKSITSTAELTFGLILCVARKICPCHNSVLGKNFQRDKYLGVDLNGKTLGIIGMGRIGTMVAEYANAFNMKVNYTDLKPVEKLNKKYSYKYFDKLISESDIITLHVSVNENNYNLISYEQFKMMKPTAFVINTSRGHLLNEEALLHALNNKMIAGAALDVYKWETMGKNFNEEYLKLLTYANCNENLMLTSHIGGATLESIMRSEEHVFKKLFNII